MRITLAVVGKLKEKYWRDAITEYSKRLSKYCKLDIVEVADEKIPENAHPAEEENVKVIEGKKLLKAIPENSFAAVLAINARQYSSEEFAGWINERRVKGDSHITFVIGGSLGLSDEVMKRADMEISFSRMTFPHQLMRVVLLEQIYRGFRIINNEPYHK